MRLGLLFQIVPSWPLKYKYYCSPVTLLHLKKRRKGTDN
jgi:hypothetical protein